MAEPKIKKKTIEEFRVEITDSIYKSIRKETTRSATFTRAGNYLEAKISEARIEGLHLALSSVIDAVSIIIDIGKSDERKLRDLLDVISQEEE